KSTAEKKDTAMMPLFYTKPTALDAKAHARLGLKKNFGLGFTAKVNAVPVNLIELPQICHYYPIAFAPDATGTPVAILGLRESENLFRDKKGELVEDSYIPASIRRYPFIFSEMPNSDQRSLCIDYAESIIATGGEQRFVDDEGKPTALS